MRATIDRFVAFADDTGVDVRVGGGPRPVRPGLVT
jgi:hypothetical protein